MVRRPLREDGARLGEGLTHGGAALSHGIEPNREFDRLIHKTAGAVINLFGALFHAGWVVGYLAYGSQLLAGKGAREGGTHVRAVSEDAHVVVIADALGLSAFDDEILEQSVDRVGNPVCFPPPRFAGSK